MVISTENTTLLQSNSHPRPVLPTLAASQAASSQSPAQLLKEKEEFHILWLAGGMLSLDFSIEIFCPL